jgi:L-threonylcarbamoyladenylate synthase
MTILAFSTRADLGVALPLVAEHLARGGLLAYPTETVYGIGSRARDEELTTLAEVTDRPPGKPFLLLVSGQLMARDNGLSFSDAAMRLADRFWPGPLTLILPGVGSSLPNSLRNDAGGIAVRFSSHRHTSSLIESLGIPLTSTSANQSGMQPLPDAHAIRSEFSDAAQSGRLMILDGGRLQQSYPSTLVDCTSAMPTVLREGAISSSVVMECVEEVSS